MMRVSLCLGLVTAASGCSFAPCDNGCDTIMKQDGPFVYKNTAVCTAVGLQNIPIPFNTCQTPVSNVTTLTPNVCRVSSATFNGPVECITTGECTVSLSVVTNYVECDCGPQCPVGHTHVDTCNSSHDCTPSPKGGFCVLSACIPFPCSDMERCTSNPQLCVTEPCPLHRCEPMVTCLAMPTCDEGDIVVTTCPTGGCYQRAICGTTITCSDPCKLNPCMSGMCRPEPKQCVAAPCPQYRCEGMHTCEARPTCDGDYVVHGNECPQDVGCYKRSMCGHDVLCIGEDRPCCEAMPTCSAGTVEGPPCTAAELAMGICSDVEYCCTRVSCRVTAPVPVKALTCGSWYTRVARCAGPDVASRVCVEKDGVSCLLKSNPCADEGYPCSVYGSCVADPKVCVTTPCPQYRCTNVTCAALPSCAVGDYEVLPADCLQYGSECYSLSLCGSHVYCKKNSPHTEDDDIPKWALALVIFGCALILVLSGVVLYLVLFKLKVPPADTPPSKPASYPDNVSLKRVSVVSSTTPYKEDEVNV